MRLKWWIVLGTILCFSLITSGIVKPQGQIDDLRVEAISSYWAGDYKSALISFNAILTELPENAEALAYRGAILARQGNEEGAEADFALSTSLSPATEDDIVTRRATLVEIVQGDIDLDQGRLMRGGVTGFDLKRTEPDNPIGYYLLGRAILSDSQSDPAHSISDFDDAIQHDTKAYPGLTASIYAYRAEAYRRVLRYDESLTDIDTALDYYSDHHAALRVQGNLSLDREQYQLTITQLSHLLDLYPDDVQALGMRGKAYTMIGEYEPALKDLDAAIAVIPRYGFVLFTRAQVYMAVGEHQKAVNDLNIVLEIDPVYAYGFAMRGEAYGWLEELDKSLDDLNRSIELYPEGAHAWRSRGITYASMGKYDLAMTNLNEAVRLDPASRNSHYARMNIAFSQGQFMLALIDFISLINIDLNAAYSS